jgi:hypothetical protein
MSTHKANGKGPVIVVGYDGSPASREIPHVGEET